MGRCEPAKSEVLPAANEQGYWQESYIYPESSGSFESWCSLLHEAAFGAGTGEIVSCVKKVLH